MNALQLNNTTLQSDKTPPPPSKDTLHITAHFYGKSPVFKHTNRYIAFRSTYDMYNLLQLNHQTQQMDIRKVPSVNWLFLRVNALVLD
jgi:hypothetical protein